MKKKLSDNDIDRMLRTLVCEAGADDETVKDVAGSPTLWWGVQRGIAGQKAGVRSPWPPANALRRWLMIGIPALAAVILVVAIITMRPGYEPGNGATDLVKTSPEAVPAERTPEIGRPSEGPEPRESSVTDVKAPTTIKAKTSFKPDRQPKMQASTTPNKAEIRSDFIALSYAQDPESGQLIRVRVPRSMMVSVGLVSSVAKPTDLVDAEVIVGDDGLTRAIRFIHR
jgi:hypothetical protein